jgi:hypothetical protein
VWVWFDLLFLVVQDLLEGLLQLLLHIQCSVCVTSPALELLQLASKHRKVIINAS